MQTVILTYNTNNITILDRYDMTICRANPNALFVFGDNLIRKGKRGQAIIRDEPNAFGIPTKRLPSMGIDAFFSDKKEEQDIVMGRLMLLKHYHIIGKYIVFPKYGIGTGLAKLDEYSPEIFKLIDRCFKEWFKVDIMNR